MKKSIAAALFVMALLALTAVPALAQAAFPHAFYGAVSIDGAAAPAGTIIEARGTGVVTGASGNPLTTTASGQYGGAGALDPKLVVQGSIADGATIEFFVNGVKATQTAAWHSGQVTLLNLAAAAPPPGTPSVPALTAVSALSQTQVKLDWTYDGQNLTGFRIERSRDNFINIETTLTAPAAADRTFTDGSLTAATTYYYRIFALNGNLASAASAILSAATQSPGGGGGGGGSAQLTGTGLTGTGPGMDGGGKTLSAGTLTTTDGKCSLVIPINTTIRNAAGAAQFTVSASAMASPPAAPPQGAVIVAYEMGPTGVTFSPAFTISMTYTDAQIPAGMPESSFYIARWDGSAWVKLTSTVSAATNTVTAQVDHFSSFGLLAQAQQPTTTPPTTTPATTTPTTTPATTPSQTTAPPITNPTPPNITVGPTPPPSEIPVLAIIGGAAAGAAVLALGIMIIKRKQGM